MEKETCDICGSTQGPFHSLLESYKTRDIKQVCSACDEIINKQLSKIKTVTTNILISLFKRFLQTTREQFMREKEKGS
jgi:hypothetical protein